MSGDWLALGAVAAIAAAGAARRGSRAIDLDKIVAKVTDPDLDQLIATATRAFPDWQLPTVGTPRSDAPSRWARGWQKGGAWAREQLEAKPMNTMDPKARDTVAANVLKLPDLERLERNLRLGYGSLLQPHRIADARRLGNVASDKLREALTTDQRAFWTGVGAYTVRVIGAWTDDGERAEDFIDRMEIAFVRAWRKRKGSRAQPGAQLRVDSRDFGRMLELRPLGTPSWEKAIGGIAVERDEPTQGPCRQAIDRLNARGFPGRTYAVTQVLLPEDARGAGLGKALYRAMLLHLVDRHSGAVTLVPDICEALRPTSQAANRVWHALARELPSERFEIRGQTYYVLNLPAKVALPAYERFLARRQPPLQPETLAHFTEPFTRKNGSPATGAPYRFSGDMCVSTHADIVNWSTDDWWHPTTATQIEWSEFRDAVEITPQVFTATQNLGWQEGWEPFEQFVARDDGWRTEPGGGTASWFKGTLPSGLPFYVWQGSGIEHWWTPGGEPIDQQAELALIEAIEPQLNAIAQQRNVQLADTKRLLHRKKPH